MDPLETVALDGPKKFTYVNSLLSKEEKEQLQRILLRNINVFAWNHSDMTGIVLMLASHKLNVIPSKKPMRQKVRRFHPHHHQIMQIELDNLEWLANVVVVINKGGKWKVCMDYTDLNEACPKDIFPLPRID